MDTSNHHLTDARDELDRSLVAALADGTYEQVADEFNVSRGRVYSAACKLGARKHEQRIQMRKAERKRLQIEFAESVLNATVKADVLDFLDGLPSECAGAIITSPPYNMAKPYSAAGDDSYQFTFYLGWLLQVVSECARVLEQGGILFLQVGATRGPDGNSLYPIDIMLFQHLQAVGLTFQSRVVWTIPHGLTPKRRLAERYETALVFSKGLTPRTFNPTPARQPQKNPGKRAFKGPRKGELSGHPFGAFPTNVWDIGNAGHNRKDGVVGHPAQMPSELARRAILLYTRPEDLVIDPFSGSGTTHAECIRTGRAFCGADLNFEDLRAARLAKVSPDLVSALPGVTDESLAVWAAEAIPVHVPAASPEPEQLCFDEA